MLSTTELTNKHKDEIYENVVEEFIGTDCSEEALKGLRNKIQKYVIDELCYVGAVVKIKATIDSKQKIKSVEVIFDGKPVYDPMLPALIERAEKVQGRLQAYIQHLPNGERYVEYKTVVTSPLLVNSEDLSFASGGPYDRIGDFASRVRTDTVLREAAEKAFKKAAKATPIKPKTLRQRIAEVFSSPVATFNKLVDRYYDFVDGFAKDAKRYRKIRTLRNAANKMDWERLAFEPEQIEANAQSRVKEAKKARQDWWDRFLNPWHGLG